MSYQWIELNVKHSGKCIQCGKWIMYGEKALWMQGLGIKHIECPIIDIEPVQDDTRLVIIDQEDKEMLGIK